MNDETRVPTMHMARERHFIPFSEIVQRTEYKLFSEEGPGFLLLGTDHRMETDQGRTCLL